MKERNIWVVAALVVLGAAVVYWALRTGRLDQEPPEGVALLGGAGESNRGHIPAGWQPPPPIGSDPSFRGPDPSAPMRFSPYAMATSKRVLRRNLPRDNGDPGMAEAIAAAIRDIPGDIGYLGSDQDDRFARFSSRMRAVDPEPFEGTDDRPVAAALSRSGMSLLIVSAREPAVGPWMEARAAGLRVRLRDAVPLAHFQPLVIGRAHVLYRITPPMEIDDERQQRITTWLRAALTNQSPGALGFDLPTAPVGRPEHRVIVSLRARGEDRVLGRRVASRSETGATLEAALGATAERLERDWAEIHAEAVDRYGVSLPREIAPALDRMEIEVEVAHRMARITDRGNNRLLWQIELGLEGMYLERNGRFFYMSPATPIQRASGRDFRGERGMVEKFMEWNGLDEDDWRDDDADFGRFETHHWLETRPGGDVVALYRNVPLITVADVTRDNLVNGLRLGAMWLVNNQLDDGQFRYRYKPLEASRRGRWIAGNNIVRHALNPYTLLLVNRVAPDERLVQSARRGIEFTVEHIRRHEIPDSDRERCYVWHRDVPAPYENAKMGTVAVTILSILAMGSVMDITEYESVLSCLAEELLYMQDPNGHFRQYDVPEEHDYYGCENSIFPGEMMLALARMYAHTNDERFRQGVDRAMEWYQQWWALNVDNTTRDGVYNEEDRVNLVGFVPWTVMAMNAMHAETNGDGYADFAFQLQDWMDGTFFFDPMRTSYPDYMGSYFKRHNELPAINSAGYTEGAASAYAIALRTNRDVERRRQVLILGTRYAMQIEYEGYSTSYYIPDPETAMGGFRFNLNFSRSRNDYSYHAMSTLSQALEFLRPEDYPALNPLTLPATLAAASGDQTAPQPSAEETATDAAPAGDAGPPGDAGAPDASTGD